MSVILADGGVAIGDLAVLRDQPGVFGPVASTGDGVAGAGLGRRRRCWSRLKSARAAARERAWLLRGEAGRPLPTVRCAGTVVPGLVIDMDATLVTCHSEKQGAAATFKHGFGYHPLLAWLDNTGEALAGMLRPGNATPTPPPTTSRSSTRRWRRSPTSTGTARRSWSAPTAPAPPRRCWRICGRLREQRGLDVSFSVGFPLTNPVKDAIGGCRRRRGRSRSTPPANPARSTSPGCRSRRSPTSPACSRPDRGGLAGGMRVLVRRERPHPGAQISVFEAHDGWRYQCLATDTPAGQLAWLEARHRAHARVEDRIRNANRPGWAGSRPESSPSTRSGCSSR